MPFAVSGSRMVAYGSISRSAAGVAACYLLWGGEHEEIARLTKMRRNQRQVPDYFAASVEIADRIGPEGAEGEFLLGSRMVHNRAQTF
jgi:hypothetical protein